MLLRDHRPDDLDAIHLINHGAVPAVGATTREQLTDIADEAIIALTAEVDGEVAGFALVLGPGASYGSGNYAWFSERYDDFVYLDRIAIAPPFRRRGIGAAMYAEVERLAAQRRPTATDFLLEVNLRPRNDSSLAFHERLGFTEVGRRETDYGALVAMLASSLGRTPPTT